MKIFFKKQRIANRIEKMESENYTFKKAKILKDQNRKEDLFVNIYGTQINFKHFLIGSVVFMLIMIFTLLKSQ